MFFFNIIILVVFILILFFVVKRVKYLDVEFVFWLYWFGKYFILKVIFFLLIGNFDL